VARKKRNITQTEEQSPEEAYKQYYAEEDKGEEGKETIEELKEEFQEEKVKKRKGRKPKVEIEREQGFITSGTFFGSVLLEILIARLPNPKPLSDVEKNAFNDATTRLFEKYAHYLLDYSEEVGFLLVTSVILIPRLKKQKIESREGSSDLRKDGDRENDVLQEIART